MKLEFQEKLLEYDFIKAVFQRLGKMCETFNYSTSTIQNTFYEIKETHPEILRSFFFSLSGTYAHSSELEQRLTMMKGGTISFNDFVRHETAYVPAVIIKSIEEKIIPRFNEEQLKIVDKTAELLYSRLKIESPHSEK